MDDDIWGDSSGTSSSSDIIASIAGDVASVTNTALITQANPVNAAIATNTPISTPYLSTGYAGTTGAVSSSFTWVAIAVLVVIGFFAFSGTK